MRLAKYGTECGAQLAVVFFGYTDGQLPQTEAPATASAGGLQIIDNVDNENDAMCTEEEEFVEVDAMTPDISAQLYLPYLPSGG